MFIIDSYLILSALIIPSIISSKNKSNTRKMNRCIRYKYSMNEKGTVKYFLIERGIEHSEML